MSSSVLHHILREVQQEGQITFARFMELALFAPRDGYYSSAPRTGSAGDYFTSPQAHPVFGALLSLQLNQMWRLLERPTPFVVVEPGSGDGRMARDILSYSRANMPDLRAALQYLAVERSTAAIQRVPRGNGLEKVVSIGLPFHSVIGCVVSNELLDVLPVHRFTIHGGELREIFVVSDGHGGLEEKLGTPSTPMLEERLQELDVVLEDGFIGEISLGLDNWLAELSRVLQKGFVITIDYGYSADELYSAERSLGTVRCYYEHIVSANPYVRVGEQDITAHVDFTSLMKKGELHGLETLGFTTQGNFLKNLGLDGFHKALTVRELSYHERLVNQMGMHELAKPEGLGNLRVLLQGKSVGRPSLDGVTLGNSRANRLRSGHGTLDVPLRTGEHIPLLEGSYPHLAGEMPWSGSWDLG